MNKLDKLGSDGWDFFKNLIESGEVGGPPLPRHNPTIRIPRPFHLKL